GVAWTFVTPEQGQLLTEVEKLAGTLIEHMEYPDFKPGPVPDDVKIEREKRSKKLNKPASIESRVQHPELEGLSDEQIKAMFPSGAIPKSAPKSNLSSKFKRRGR